MITLGSDLSRVFVDFVENLYPLTVKCRIKVALSQAWYKPSFNGKEMSEISAILIHLRVVIAIRECSWILKKSIRCVCVRCATSVASFWSSIRMPS